MKLRVCDRCEKKPVRMKTKKMLIFILLWWGLVDVVVVAVVVFVIPYSYFVYFEHDSFYRQLSFFHNTHAAVTTKKDRAKW